MRVCEALGKCGFIEVQNIEVLQVEEIVRTRNVPVMELDFLKTKVTTSGLAPLFTVHVAGLLLAQPCFTQGNPWMSLNNIKRRARPVVMMGENTGHNPFNTFPGMAQYGNCLEIHFSFIYETINITIICGPGKLDQVPTPAGHKPRSQCPVYRPDVKWPLANLIYLEYDSQRFELSSCVSLNATHSYHGQLMLTDDIETRAHLLPGYLPMWRQRVQQPGMIPFLFDGNCSECNFRNEYVAFMPDVQQSIHNAPPEAQPYCREGDAESNSSSKTKTPNSHITMQVNVAISDLMVKLLVPAVMIFSGVLLLRVCLGGKKSTSATVVPVGQTKEAN
uniref:Uncharacterized protein n=1 Tax=Anopheles maculatus TaxID=74869 RepID=A0A182TC82_9DIPT